MLFFPDLAHALRLVSLKPNITQTLIDLGYGADVIGVTRFCPRPNESAETVADYVSVQTEDVIRLKPDLILSSKENSQGRQYALLEAAGLQIAYLNFATVEDLFGSLHELGRLLNDDAVMAKAEKLRQRLDSLRTKAGKLAGRRFVVLVQRRPLLVAAGRTYVSSLLSAIGLRSVYADNLIPYPAIAEERLLATKPDLILDMSHDADKGTPFYGRDVHLIRIEDFLAAPSSFDSLADLVKVLSTKEAP